VRPPPCAKAPARASAGQRGRAASAIWHERFSAQNIPSEKTVFFGIKKGLIRVRQRTSTVFFAD
jgi:hypothetical protein